jgi:hypothetical protein
MHQSPALFHGVNGPPNEPYIRWLLPGRHGYPLFGVEIDDDLRFEYCAQVPNISESRQTSHEPPNHWGQVLGNGAEHGYYTPPGSPAVAGHTGEIYYPHPHLYAHTHTHVQPPQLLSYNDNADGEIPVPGNRHGHGHGNLRDGVEYDLTPSSSFASGSSGTANSGEEPDGDAPVPPSRLLMVSDTQRSMDLN